MASNSTHNLTTLKRGWLSIQRPDKKGAKDYFAFLRPNTVDCYRTPAESERKATQPALQLQLRNCILIQALKKENVKNGFSLLIVPDGMYILSAVSETERTSWLNNIRETISKQVAQDLETEEQAKQSAEKKRKISLGSLGDRIRLHRNRHKGNVNVSEDIPWTDRERPSSSMLLRSNQGTGRNSPLSVKVSSSAISLQDGRTKYSDRLGTSNYPTVQLSSTDIRRTSDRDLPRSRTNLNNAGKPINNASRAQNNNSKHGSNISIREVAKPLNDNWASESSVRKDHVSNSGNKYGSTGNYRNSLSTDVIPLANQNKKPVADQRSPELKYPLVRHIYSPDRDLSSSDSSRQATPVPINQRAAVHLNSRSSNTPVSTQLSPDDKTNRPNLATVTITQAGTQQPKTSPIKSPEPTEKSSLITITHAAGKSASSSRVNTPVVAAQPQKINLNRAYDAGSVKQSPLPQAKAASGQTGQWKNAGVSPSSGSFTRDTSRASFYTVRRNERRGNESRNVSVAGRKDIAGPIFRVDSQDSLYLENQKLREQIRALTTTNYELEAKINFYGQRINQREMAIPVKYTVPVRPVSRMEGRRYKMDYGHDTNGLREISIPVDRKRSSSVEPGNGMLNKRVESWLQDTAQLTAAESTVKEVKAKNRRKVQGKYRRSTTSDIPTPEDIYTLSHNLPVEIDRTELKTSNPYGNFQTKGRPMNTETNLLGSESPLMENAKFTLSPPRSQSRLLTPTIPEPIDPRFAASMWCRLVDLWSNLLNEERSFWKSQLQHLFAESLKRQFEQDPNDLIDVLDKANRQHTEETVELWKHIYESWIPRDYLDYLTNETRKMLLCLHSVIDSLFTMVDEIRAGQNSDQTGSRLNQLRDQMARAGAIDGLVPESERNNSDSSEPESYSVRKNSNGMNHSVYGRPHSQLSGQSWKQTKLLLRQSHSELLDQVYNVAELVGAALDTEMEDNIRSARARGEPKVDPLTPLPPSGLEAAAKLQSVVLDLESRLEALEIQDCEVHQINSQPIVSPMSKSFFDTPHTTSETDQRSSHHMYNSIDNHQTNHRVEGDGDEDGDTYGDVDSNRTTPTNEKVPFTILTTTTPMKSDGKPTNGPVILVLHDTEELERYRRNAEIADPMGSISYQESDVLSIDTYGENKPELYDWRTRRK